MKQERTDKEIRDDERRNHPHEADGKYAVRNFDQVCKCGHSLGEHAAEMPRDCFSDDDCDCEKFTKTRRVK